MDDSENFTGISISAPEVKFDCQPGTEFGCPETVKVVILAKQGPCLAPEVTVLIDGKVISKPVRIEVDGTIVKNKA